MSVRFLHWKTVLSLPFPYCALWREVTICSSHLRSGECGSTSLREEYLHYLLGFLLHGSFVSFPPFIHLFMSVWNHQYLLFTLGYGPKLLSFVAKRVPGLAIGNSFSGLLCHVHMPPPLWPFLVCFWAFPYFVALSDPPGSPCVFPAPVLESGVY